MEINYGETKLKIAFTKNVLLFGIYISTRADGGPRFRVYARETLRSAPIDVSGNFPAHMSAESPSNISPNL